MTALDLALVLASAVLHAIWNALAKRSADPLAFITLLSLGWVALVGPVLWFVPFGALSAHFAWCVAASAVSHVLYQVWLARAYVAADFTVVYPISRSTPAAVALISVPLLGDPVSAAGVVGIGVVMLGVWLVQTRGEVGLSALVQRGTGWAYLTLLATVGYSLADQQGMRALDVDVAELPVPRALVFFALMVVATTALLVPYALRKVARTSWAATWRASRGSLLWSTVSSVLSYVLILDAMRRAPISYITCVRQTSVLFAAWLGMRMLGETPGRVRVAGSTLVVAGVALIALWGE